MESIGKDKLKDAIALQAVQATELIEQLNAQQQLVARLSQLLKARDAELEEIKKDVAVLKERLEQKDAPPETIDQPQAETA